MNENRSMYWPYFEIPEEEQRDHNSLLHDYDNLDNGIVRESPILVLKDSVDLSKFVALDYMHQHCEGKLLFMYYSHLF